MLKVTAAAERALWAMVRAAIASGPGYLRRVAEGVVDELRPAPAAPLEGQLGLWVVDAEGHQPRPWRLSGDTRFACRALACELTVAECVARQEDSARHRTKDTWRGQSGEFPHCVTAACAQGRGLRESLEPDLLAELQRRAARPNRSLSPGEKRKQRRAKRLAARAGLLEDPPTIDLEPETVPE